jgi:hypothetical protein
MLPMKEVSFSPVPSVKLRIASPTLDSISRAAVDLAKLNSPSSVGLWK